MQAATEAKFASAPAVPALDSWRPPKYMSEAPIIESLVRGSGGKATPEAETLLALGRLLKVANLPTLIKKLKRKKSDTICVFFSKNDVYRPRYVTDYCTVMKTNRLVHFG